MWIGRSACRCISSSAATIYHDVAGASFKDLLAGKLSQFPGERATQSDWANHVSTIFPEVRLKRYLEMRGADVGGQNHIAALAAFWTGILYDSKRSMPRGIWSRIGARRIGMVCGRRCRRLALNARSAAVRCAMSRAMRCDCLAKACNGEAFSTRRAGRNPSPRLREPDRRKRQDAGRTAARKVSRRVGQSVLPAFSECRF